MAVPLSPIVDRMRSCLVGVEIPRHLFRIISKCLGRYYKACQQGTHRGPHLCKKPAPKAKGPRARRKGRGELWLKSC